MEQTEVLTIERDKKAREYEQWIKQQSDQDPVVRVQTTLGPLKNSTMINVVVHSVYEENLQKFVDRAILVAQDRGAILDSYVPPYAVVQKGKPKSTATDLFGELVSFSEQVQRKKLIDTIFDKPTYQCVFDILFE